MSREGLYWAGSASRIPGGSQQDGVYISAGSSCLLKKIHQPPKMPVPSVRSVPSGKGKPVKKQANGKNARTVRTVCPKKDRPGSLLSGLCI